LSVSLSAVGGCKLTHTITEVPFEDVRRELILGGGATAAEIYSTWRRQRQTWTGYEGIAPFVEATNHQFLYTVTEQMVDDVKRHSTPSEHALGNLKKSEVVKVGFEDVHIPWANEFLFHRYLEETRSLPKWPEWWKWLKSDGRRFYIDVVKQKKGWDKLPSEQRDALRDAVQWRLGKAYYSAIREVELLTKLRSRFHLPVKYHVLADVLFKVDLWINKTIVSVYFENPEYRAQNEGRKRRPEGILDSSFSFREITVPVQPFGKVWIIKDSDIAALAQRLQDTV